MTRHRDERERTRLVRAWRRSGQSARAFAAQHGISETTIFNWARAAEPDSNAVVARSEVQLVEVVPMTAGPSEVEAWSWEIETRGGIVRGRGALDASAIGAIVDSLGKVRR